MYYLWHLHVATEKWLLTKSWKVEKLVQEVYRYRWYRCISISSVIGWKKKKKCIHKIYKENSSWNRTRNGRVRKRMERRKKTETVIKLSTEIHACKTVWFWSKPHPHHPQLVCHKYSYVIWTFAVLWCCARWFSNQKNNGEEKKKGVWIYRTDQILKQIYHN